MLYKKNVKNKSGSLEEKLEFQKGLSAFDKKLEAGFLVEDINSVNVDNAFSSVIVEINKHFSIKRTILIITRIAAIFTLPLLAFTIWSLFQVKNSAELVENPITWQKIQSPVGMRSHIILPDGSNLWLNAGSEIKYGVPFTRESREVQLNGEAFLQVVKNEQAPFIVYSGNTQVKVIGTQFNIKAYDDDPNIEVALVEGNIVFYFNKSNNKRVYTELKPNDYLVLNKQSSEVKKENRDLGKYISWHKNILVFDDTPMIEVASALERWYGVKVIIASKDIHKYKITTTFENEPLFRVLELLELSSPISIKYKPGKFNNKIKKVSNSIVTITKK